jgi:hypothetical protein
MKVELDMSTKGFRIIFRCDSGEGIVTFPGKSVKFQKSNAVIRMDVSVHKIKSSNS